MLLINHICWFIWLPLMVNWTCVITCKCKWLSSMSNCQIKIWTIKSIPTKHTWGLLFNNLNYCEKRPFHLLLLIHSSLPIIHNWLYNVLCTCVLPCCIYEKYTYRFLFCQHTINIFLFDLSKNKCAWFVKNESNVAAVKFCELWRDLGWLALHQSHPFYSKQV